MRLMKLTMSTQDELEKLAAETWNKAKGLVGRTTVWVSLSGPLGAGKTTWVKAFAKAAGIDPDTVVSPTYVLNTEYRISKTEIKLQHIDVYRLEEESEFWRLGVEEMVNNKDVVVVEWADKFPGIKKWVKNTGAGMVEIKLDFGEDENERKVEINEDFGD